VCFSNVCEKRTNRVNKHTAIVKIQFLTFCAKSIGTKTLHTQMGDIKLKELLLGTPLGNREGTEQITDELDQHLIAISELIPSVYGNSSSCKHAVMELRRVVDSDNIDGKRALLLYSLFAEPEICQYWKNYEDGSAELATDLRTRVLPFVVPRFFQHTCQSPDAFVTLTMVLAEMWQGEKLGNWPFSPL